MTISCISGDDVSVVIPTTCNSDGTKTATVRTVNNSSSEDQFTVDTDYLDKTTAKWLEELIESP